MTAYGGALARHYDALMAHVNYSEWAGYIGGLFDCAQTPLVSVLDMACGTGSLSYALAGQGFDVVSVDASPDMLAAAEAKRAEKKGDANNPLFLCQKLWALDLRDTVDAAVSMLDSLNYVTRPELLKRALARVFLFLNPGGVLVFDVRSPLFFERYDGASQTGETPSCFCVWTQRYGGDVCATRVEIFERAGASLWTRHRETHRQRCYTPGFLRDTLAETGFEHIEAFQPFERVPPAPDALRVFFRARKPL